MEMLGNIDVFKFPPCRPFPAFIALTSLKRVVTEYDLLNSKYLTIMAIFIYLWLYSYC